MHCSAVKLVGSRDGLQVIKLDPSGKLKQPNIVRWVNARLMRAGALRGFSSWETCPTRLVEEIETKIADLDEDFSDELA